MPLDLGVTVEIKGLRELQQRLASLPREIGIKALRRSIAAGAGVIRNAARSAAPAASEPIRRGKGVATAPGTLKRAALIKFIKAESTDTQAFYIVGFRQGKRSQKSNRDAFYATWVEFGHRIVPRRSKNARRGALAANRRAAAASGASVPPYHGGGYFRPAWEANKQAALQKMQDRLAAELKKFGA